MLSFFNAGGKKNNKKKTVRQRNDSSRTVFKFGFFYIQIIIPMLLRFGIDDVSKKVPKGQNGKRVLNQCPSTILRKK